MPDKEKLEQAARRWIEAWNTRDFSAIMSHYAEDIKFRSAAAERRWKGSAGQLAGKAAVEKHFRRGIEEVPELRFEFHSILYAPDTILLLYRRENGRLAADSVRFNEAMKVTEVISFRDSL
ncbi:MAG: nuclear transport factor 2 family protein [Chitinophagales bacterium]